MVVRTLYRGPARADASGRPGWQIEQERASGGRAAYTARMGGDQDELAESWAARSGPLTALIDSPGPTSQAELAGMPGATPGPLAGPRSASGGLP
jgi:hypothetical protein